MSHHDFIEARFWKKVRTFSKKGGTRPPSPREVNSRGSSPAVGRFAPSGLPSLFPRLIEMIQKYTVFRYFFRRLNSYDQSCFPAGQRFADPACQVERGRTGGNDTDSGNKVDDQLEIEADVMDLLGFVNHQQPMLADKRLQLLDGLVGKMALNGDIFTVHQQLGLGFPFQEPLNQGRLAGSPGPIHNDHLPGLEQSLEICAVRLLDVHW